MPTKGAVQVNDVSEKVNPIKRRPMILLDSLFLERESSFVSTVEGILRLYAPKRLIAKLMKIPVMTRLTQGLAANLFIPAAPNSTANATPRAVKVRMIPSAKISASRIAPARCPAAWFVKYETVIGTIGKTHGVKSESAPTDIASQMNDHKERSRPGLFATAYCPGPAWLPASGLTEAVEPVSSIVTPVVEAGSLGEPAGEGDGSALLELVDSAAGDGDGEAFWFGLGDGDAAAVAADSVTATFSFAVFGGMHMVSLHA